MYISAAMVGSTEAYQEATEKLVFCAYIYYVTVQCVCSLQMCMCSRQRCIGKAFLLGRHTNFHLHEKYSLLARIVGPGPSNHSLEVVMTQMLAYLHVRSLSSVGQVETHFCPP